MFYIYIFVIVSIMIDICFIWPNKNGFHGNKTVSMISSKLLSGFAIPCCLFLADLWQLDKTVLTYKATIECVCSVKRVISNDRSL